MDIRQSVEAECELGVALSEGFLSNGESSAAEELGLIISALGYVYLGQSLGAGGDLYVVVPEHRGRHPKGSLE